ncbi:MAG: response regulator [Bdellovibrionaceae bacterium]|nr:response regulator [Pseudobdellovibrionaceae bacterium]
MFPKETRFLVVDDFSTMRKIIKKVLNELGYSLIDEADDGRTALPLLQKAALTSQPYGLIISDWSMPFVTGIDLLKACKADESLCSLPFILITAESEQKHIREAAKAGVSDYIVKPFNAATLKAKMERVYQQHTADPIAKAS